MKPRTKFWEKLADTYGDFRRQLEESYKEDLKYLSDIALLELIKECLQLCRRQIERNGYEHLSAHYVSSVAQEILRDRGLEFDYSTETLMTKEEYRAKYFTK